MKNFSIVVSAPGKIHLLGEHAVVYGKPALLAAVNLRATVTLNPCHSGEDPERSRRGRLQNLDSGRVPSSLARMTKVIEPLVKQYLNIKTIPPYQVTISSQIPVGSGLGSSAAISAAYIAALLTLLKFKWDLTLINNLTFEAEKVFHGNPSGGDNSAVVYGGFIWFRKETPDLKIIHPLLLTIPPELAKNFILINTGKPEQTTKDMVMKVKNLYGKNPKSVNRFLENQEKLVRELLPVLKEGNEKELIRIIREGERGLENIGVVSSRAVSIIRIIDTNGGAAKICGGGGKTAAAGALLCYHRNISVIEQIAKSYQLPYFKTSLGVEGLRQETLLDGMYV